MTGAPEAALGAGLALARPGAFLILALAAVGGEVAGLAEALDGALPFTAAAAREVLGPVLPPLPTTGAAFLRAVFAGVFGEATEPTAIGERSFYSRP